MLVDEILTFDQYWRDERFGSKRPVMRGSVMQRYGDNIYHRDANSEDFIQEDSFHSQPGGVMSPENRATDTATTENVLLASEFAYWGRSGPQIPEELRFLIKKGPGHKCNFSEEQVTAIKAWLATFPQRGYLGEPAHWSFLKA